MRKNRLLALVGGVAAIGGALALAPNAQAACSWTGYAWACDQSAGPQVAAAPITPLPSVPPGSNWGTQRYTPQGYNYNNFDQIPNDYPGPALTTPSGKGGGGDHQ